MSDNTIINEKQEQIKLARVSVRENQKTLADTRTELKKLTKSREGGIDGPLDPEVQRDLIRRMDDTLDLLDRNIENLEAKIGEYARLDEINRYPELKSTLVRTKGEAKVALSDVKIADEAVRKATFAENKARVALNEEGYQNFVSQTNAKLQFAEETLSDLIRNGGPEEEIAEQEAIIADLTQRLEDAEHAHGVLNENLVSLSNAKAVAERNLTNAGSAYEGVMERLDSELLAYCEISDPRYLVSQLNDDTPFLLMPVRVETRYMTVKHVRRNTPIEEVSPVKDVAERVEADEVAKKEPAKVEVSKEKEVVEKKVEEVKKEEIKKEVVKEPLGFSIPDKKELWVRFFPDDITAHTHEERLTADEEIAGQDYWNEVWDPLVEPGSSVDPKLGAWRAISGAYGPQRAAWIIKETEPTNLGDDPLPAAPVFPVLSAKLSAWTETPKSYVMPDRFVVRLYSDETNYREITGNAIPDPLILGIGPNEDPDYELEQIEGEIGMPDEIKWLSDFKEAERIGMAVSIPLETEEETHIERIIVLGLKLSADKTESTRLVEELIENHHYTAGGFSFLPQGTPTNNSENSQSGYAKIDADEEKTYATELGGNLFDINGDAFEKKDGQWFADMLGINADVVQNIFHADGTDICEALAMNRALYPATLGYYLRQMLHPHVNDSDRKLTRDFFNENVTGRGKIPVFRVDDQPYGIIPGTAFSKWSYSGIAGQEASYLNRLNTKVLQPMYDIWGLFVNDYVKHINPTNPPLNPSEDFINILGLHASSIEFHQRFANGTFKMWNIWRFLNDSGTEVPAGFPILNGASIDAFLSAYNSHLTMAMVQPPKIFELNFLEEQRLLNGPVIDGFKALPYSETRGIQPFPETGWNYIHWLLDPSTTIARIREEIFDNVPGAAADQKPPKALLYLLLRHAYLLQYLETSTGILIGSNVVGTEAELEVELQKIESPDVVTAEEKSLIFNQVSEEKTILKKADIKLQVEEEFAGVEVARFTKRLREEELFAEQESTLERDINIEYSERVERYRSDQLKWNYLTEPVPEVSGDLSMELHINNLLAAGSSKTQNLANQRESLEKLKGLPTARLERSFAEHLDLCNYRLDSWMIGMVNQRLESQQSKSRGTYLGAFGVLENLNPNESFPGIHVIEVDGYGNELSTSPAVKDTFTYIGEAAVPLERDPDSGKVRAVPSVDPTNQGFIHTPSINHAVTAAILRAGYMAHLEADSNDDTFAVNLTSQRIRRALYYLEGIRNGQNLPALLGYRFERELHDRSAEFGTPATSNNLDQYILDIRLAYPLVAGGVSDTDTAAIETQEARNVVDGLELVNAYDADNTILDAIITDATHRGEVITVIDIIRDDMDAVADLLLSESVFQMARGNAERSGAVLKALGEGAFVEEPEIIHTPRQGDVLTHRFGIHFDATKTAANVWTLLGTARSIAEPGLNGWLGDQLPAAGKVLFNIEYDTTVGEITTTTAETISAADLGIEPIDLVYLIGDQGSNQDATELSSRIAYHIYKNLAMTDDAVIRILYTDATDYDPDEFNLIQLLPLLTELKRLIGNSRPLEVNDYLLAGDSQSGVAPDLLFTGLDTSATKNRIKEAAGIVPGFAANLSDLTSSLNTAITTAGDPGDPMPVDPVAALNDLRNQIIAATNFGITHTYPSKLYDNSEAERDNLVSLGKRVHGILNARFSKVDDLMTEVDGLSEVKVINRKLTEAGQTLFGRAFKVYPDFELLNANEVNNSRSNGDLLQEIGDMAAEEWMQSTAKVRAKMTNYQKVRLLADSISGVNAPDLAVTQLPVISTTTDRWVGMKLPEDYNMEGDTLSLVLELPENNNAAALQAGMVIDEWTESIPNTNVQSGVAMHFNQPNAEAPNSLIMAVSPQLTGRWEWDDLMETVIETLDLAKRRAVEPDHLKETVWGQVLPALIASVSSNDATPSVDFGRNIVNAPSGQFGPIFPAEYAMPDVE